MVAVPALGLGEAASPDASQCTSPYTFHELIGSLQANPLPFPFPRRPSLVSGGLLFLRNATSNNPRRTIEPTTATDAATRIRNMALNSELKTVIPTQRGSHP